MIACILNTHTHTHLQTFKGCKHTTTYENVPIIINNDRHKYQLHNKKNHRNIIMFQSMWKCK